MVSDDGKPNPPGAVTSMWAFMNGPARITFPDPYSLSNTLVFADTGTNILRLIGDEAR